MADQRDGKKTLRAQIEESMTMTRAAEIMGCFSAAVFGLGLGALVLLQLANDYDGYLTGGLFCGFGLIGVAWAVEVIRRDERHIVSLVFEGFLLITMGLGFILEDLLWGAHKPGGRTPLEFFALVFCGAMVLTGLLMFWQAIQRARKPPGGEPPESPPTPSPPP